MEKTRVLVCSAWPYASGVPHLGNLVSSLLSGDVLARYYRMRGKDVLYVSGTDAHGTRIEFEAQQAGITPAQLAQRNHEKICRVLEGFGIAFDNYTITETQTHKTFVRDIYLQMERAGYICTRIEHRAYCRHCEKFLADRLITGTCPKCGAPDAMGNQCDVCGTILEPEELVDPKCSFCGETKIEFRETKHWYLDLPKLGPALNAYVGERGFQGNVHLFTQRMLDEGLRARAMTRDIAWGIPAPFDGAEGKVIYVWGEAALGYVSATIEHFGEDDGWKPFWFGDDVHQVYTLGKDNIPFHTLIFPGQLIASEQGYHLPDQIAATEYLNWIGGASFSKSRGVGLYCDDALRVMDGDLWRFYLLLNRPEGRDVNFSWEELDKAINGVLISNIANLINRILSFVQTKHDHVVPDVTLDPEVTETLAAAVTAYESAMASTSLAQALRTVCDLAVFGNEYFQRKKPWATKDACAVASALHLIKGMAVLLAPCMPQFAGNVLAILGIDQPVWDDLERSLGGATIGTERILLQRIEVDAIRDAIAGEPEEPREVPRVSFDDFSRLDLRIGKVISISEIKGADKLYQLQIDLGDDERTCVAGIKRSYAADELVGKSVLVLANLEVKRVRGIESQCMLLAADGDVLSVITTDRPVEPGAVVS